MFKLTDTELAALNPLIRRIGLLAVVTIAVVGFVVVGVAVHTMTGNLIAAGTVFAAQIVGAVITVGAICAWATLEDSSNRAARDASHSQPVRAAVTAPKRPQMARAARVA